MTRTHLATLAALLVLSGAAGALAADGPSTNAPAATPVAAPVTPATPAKPPKPNRDDQVICKSVPEPGSRLGGKTTCMTHREWDQMSADARDSRNHGPPQ